MTCQTCDFPDPIKHGVSREEHIAAFQELCCRSFSPPDGLQGRGIVTVGEGRYWPGIVIGAKLLREVGCTLPLQVWHREPVGDELADDPYTTLHPLYPPGHPDRQVDRWAKRKGWGAKNYAIAHSGFEKVLFLDGDAYCVNDPLPLFSLLDTYGFVYWGNIPRYLDHINRELAACLLGSKRLAAKPVQGGTYLVNCRTAWKELQIAKWYNDHADFWWRQNGNGDEDGWVLTISALESKYLWVENYSWFRGSGGLCRWNGEPYLFHRTNSKLYVGTLPRFNWRIPLERRVAELFDAIDPARKPPTMQERRRAALVNRGLAKPTMPAPRVAPPRFVPQQKKDKSCGGCGQSRMLAAPLVRKT